MALRVYNTMTKQLETFEPLHPPNVKMYVCGPTVYNYFHIGNARCFVVFDTVRRYLEYTGYRVIYVQNFTDVDDKIIRVAREEGKTLEEVAGFYIREYFEDADALGIRRADVHPRVTENIPEILSFIEQLVASGHAYCVGGDVYFRTESHPSYGVLSHQDLEELKAGIRVDVSEKKRNPLDFALWKAAKEGEPAWDSPWGKGRPGWHIECSAMNRKYLGEQIDIHAGGQDLIFPHHENERAQTEAVTHRPFAKYWMHNGYVNINNEKMSKSLGNVERVRDLRQRFRPAALRFFLLSVHYRNPLNFSIEALNQAEQSLDRMETCLRNLNHSRRTAPSGPANPAAAGVADRMRRSFCKAMDDDFNTADAIAALFEAVRDINQGLADGMFNQGDMDLLRNTLLELGGNVLGILRNEEGEPRDRVDAEILRLIDERTEARKARDFAKADAIRSRLEAMGIVLEDTPQGVRWYRKE